VKKLKALLVGSRKLPPAPFLPLKFFPSFFLPSKMASLPPPAPYFDAHAFSVGLNEFLDKSTEIINEFNDHAEMRAVAQQVSVRLMAGHDLPIGHESHPFTLYGNLDITYWANLRNLCTQIMADFADRPLIRSYVVSFFHSGGINREVLEELFDSFYEWLEDSTVAPSQEDEDEDDQSDDQSVASTVDLTQDGSNDGPEPVPSSPPMAPIAAIPISPPFPMPAYAPLLLHSSLAAHVDDSSQ
jgi:hypothetical protein